MTTATLSTRRATAAFRRPAWASGTLLLALSIAIVLTAGRALVDWPMLSITRLPDTDDMMRLAEVRDWVGGQGFNDLTQHRLGFAGASMHWSRIADLGPAAFLLLLRPVLGAANATLAMLVLYQGILLFCYLLLAARIARHLIGAEAMPVAILFAALAFPTISLFVPGRIDHHALQIVLTMVVVSSLVAPISFRQGLAGGIAAALSLAVGLEVAPEIVAAMAVLGIRWIVGGTSEDNQAAGFAAGLGGVTLILLLVARPEIWPTEWCDGFTPASSSGTLVAAAAWGGLVLAGRHVAGSRSRMLCAVGIGVIAAVCVWHTSSICFAGPYGALDPFLKRVWMDNVPEAKDLLFGQETPGMSIGYGGLCLVSLGALALVLRDPAARMRWWPFAIFLTICVIAAILQIRVTYIVAGLATLPFVKLMVDARAPGQGTARRLMLWIVGCGATYTIIGTTLDAHAAPKAIGAAGQVRDCNAGGPLRALAALPPGNVMAPLDSGSYVIGMTPHRSFAAPYHRNNAGNLAMYRFFLAPPARAAAMAHRIHVNYVAFCTSSLHERELDALRNGSLIDALQAGRVPAWLAPVASDPGGMSVYRVR